VPLGWVEGVLCLDSAMGKSGFVHDFFLYGMVLSLDRGGQGDVPGNRVFCAGFGAGGSAQGTMY